MALNSSTHRQPGEDYKGKNGFRDSVKLQMKNQLADPVVSISDTLVLDPILVKQRALHESVEKYHMAEEVLEFRGSYCPG